MDNIRDAIDKGRFDSVKGIGNCNAKLTIKQVIEIRERHDRSKRNGAALAKEYGIDNSTLHSIINYETWKEV